MQKMQQLNEKEIARSKVISNSTISMRSSRSATASTPGGAKSSASGRPERSGISSCGGYTLSERRLREKGWARLNRAVDLLAKTLTNQGLVTDEGKAVLEVVQGYSRTWRWLLEYDEQRLAGKPLQPVAPKVGLSLEDAREAPRRQSPSGRTTAFVTKKGGEVPPYAANVTSNPSAPSGIGLKGPMMTVAVA